jgi:hypothetical protein
MSCTPGVYATSRHIPGVRFAGVSHPGLIGTAPSAELLATWNKREGALIEAHIDSVPPVAYGPLSTGAYVGQELPDDVRAKIYREGARTVPGREHGGNCDVSFLYIISLDYLKCIYHLFRRSKTYQGEGSSLQAVDLTNIPGIKGLALLLPRFREGGEFVCW